MSIAPDPAATSKQPRRPADVTAHHRIEFIGIKLDAEQADDLYNEVYCLQRDHPEFFSSVPVIRSIYDGLYKAGIDGSRGFDAATATILDRSG